MGRPALRSTDSSAVKVRRSARDRLKPIFPRRPPCLGATTFRGIRPVFLIRSTASFSSAASMTPSMVSPAMVVAR